ncbi:hypothetical protein GHT09_017161 [Marmota monax]|uniref:FAM186A/B N-terminal domain-containing protein n=1 Tax=Marmota monax TaxID=9995 RepID=A0A834Q635_MARMO|nr:hypothetical protein GHT09_017161 [Marmota monax]
MKEEVEEEEEGKAGREEKSGRLETEDISTQLSDILDNVNFVINRFQEELGYDLKEKVKSHEIEQKGKKRFILLEKIASFSKDAKMKEKHLYEILRWLGDWGDSLTYEIRNRKSEEEQESLDEWIEVMEKVLPLSLTATKGGIQSLISLCSTLIEEQKKRAQSRFLEHLGGELGGDGLDDISEEKDPGWVYRCRSL